MPVQHTAPCAQCGVPFTIQFVHRDRPVPRFCSRACFSASQRTRVPRTCQWCGATFHVKPSDLIHGTGGGGSYCSTACLYESRGDPDLFWAKVDRTGDGCWEWQGYRVPDGYGSRNAHRRAWELTYGPVPAGLEVMHDCHNPPCCRPSHLRVGTHAENMAMMAAAGRGRSQYGAAHTSAKLTETDIPVIRAAIAAGEQRRHIAARYGVSHVAINAIAWGRTWRHVP